MAGFAWGHAQVFVIKHWRGRSRDLTRQGFGFEFAPFGPRLSSSNNRPCNMMVVDPTSGVLEAARNADGKLSGYRGVSTRAEVLPVRLGQQRVLGSSQNTSAARRSSTSSSK